MYLLTYSYLSSSHHEFVTVGLQPKFHDTTRHSSKILQLWPVDWTIKAFDS